VKFRTVLLVGLLIRLGLAPFLAHPFDVQTWYVDGLAVVNGTQSFTSLLVPYYYSLFLFAIPASFAYAALPSFAKAYTIQAATLGPLLVPASINVSVVPGLVFDTLVKIPLIAADTAVSYIIYRFCKEHFGDPNKGVLAASLWYLNPITIWISCGWGMFDVLPALFSLSCMYFAYNRRFILAGVALAGGVAAKYYPIVLLLPLLILAFKAKGRRSTIQASLSFMLTSGILFAPSIVQTADSFLALMAGGYQLVGPAAGIHYAGLSFWSTLTLFTGFDITLVSSLLVLISLAIAYVYLWERISKLTPFEFSFAFGLPILVLLLFFRFIGENFLIWLLPFAAIMQAQTGSPRLFWLTSGVAFVASITDSLLPYYMLPMSPWIGNYLKIVLEHVSPLRVAPAGSLVPGFTLGKIYLAALGISFCAALSLLALKWVSEHAGTEPKQRSPLAERTISCRIHRRIGRSP
jgi:hypothetical protein